VLIYVLLPYAASGATTRFGSFPALWNRALIERVCQKVGLLTLSQDFLPYDDFSIKILEKDAIKENHVVRILEAVSDVGM
jgi:hypothetical protein